MTIGIRTMSGQRVRDKTVLSVKPGAAATVQVILRTKDLDRGRCELRHETVPDNPKNAPSSVALEPSDVQTVQFADGMNEIRASCPSSSGTLADRIAVRVADGAPERCADFAFTRSPITVTTLGELNAGMVGSWEGCVTTPWVEPYWVVVTFRSDGTYSAKSTEVLDGGTIPAMYYGSDADDPRKVWELHDLHTDLTGSGTIDQVFVESNAVTRDDLRNVRLMGDSLQFEVFHFALYGPILFELMRI